MLDLDMYIITTILFRSRGGLYENGIDNDSDIDITLKKIQVEF